MKLKAIMAAALLAITTGYAARVDAKPVELTVDQFTNSQDTADRMRASTSVMTADEEHRFLQAVKALNLPAYAYSGCNDRAHAAYLLLPDTLKQKVSKVWIAGPSAFTAALPGSISVKSNAPALRDVSWSFHVALGYRTSSGYKVYDVALAPDGPLSRDAWLDLFEYPPLAAALTTAGRVYSFIQIATNDFSRNSLIWNGTYYTYDGTSYTQRWIPRALARDSVGASVVAGTTCSYLKTLAAKPEKMLTFLQGNDPDAQSPTPASPEHVASCRGSIDAFNAELARWAALIPAQNYE